MNPTEACKRLHIMLDDALEIVEWPPNGLYFFRESGELWGHGLPTLTRITRCGSHTNSGRLRDRATEHATQNSNGSVVVKHIGSALARRRDVLSLCDHWGLAQAGACEPCRNLVRDTREYIYEDLTSIIVGVSEGWKRAEKIAIGILSHCELCTRTEEWLGRHALNTGINGGRLWNVQHIGYTPTEADINWFFNAVDEPWVL